MGIDRFRFTKRKVTNGHTQKKKKGEKTEHLRERQQINEKEGANGPQWFWLLLFLKF